MDRMEAVLVKNNENEKTANSGKKPKYVKKIIFSPEDKFEICKENNNRNYFKI